MATGTNIKVIHTHNLDCDEETCPFTEGENVGVEYE
jgi:hypothetical protein